MLRTNELSDLLDVLGSPDRPTVLVAGEAGVGKSRLTEQALAAYLAAGGCGRRCVASTSLSDVPFGALVGLIPAHHIAAVADGTQRLSVFAMVLEHIIGCGATDERPFVVLIDDLHHLDDPSCGLLVQLTANAPVQLLATYRSGEVLPDGALPLWTSSRSVRLELGAFDRADMDEIVQQVLGDNTPEVRDALWHHSQGNALYLRELIVGSVAAHRIVQHGGVWVLAQPLVGSMHLSEYLLQSVRQLEPDARRVANLLALCQPLPMGMFRTDEVAALDQLIVAGVATASGDETHSEVRLAHPIYAEVIRNQLSSVAQRAVFAEAVARIGPHRRSGDDLRVTVWQLDAGESPPVDALVRAARAAMSARDLLLACRLTRAAQAIEPHHPMASLVLSDALYEIGDFAGSAEECTAALGVATNPHEQGLLAASLYRAYLWGLDDADGALAVVDFALAVTSDEESQMPLVVAAANALSFSDRPAAALERLSVLDPAVADHAEGSLSAPVREAALIQIGRTADAFADEMPPGAPALHKVVRCYAFTEHGRFDEGASIAEELRTDVIGLEITLDQMWAAVNAGRAHLMAGRPRTALVWARDAMITAERGGLTSGQALILSVLGAAHAQLGDREATEAIDRRAEELAHVRGFLRAERAVGRAWAAALRNELSRARQLLIEGADTARTAGQVVSESFLLHEHVRLGGDPQAARLAELAAIAQSPLVQARASFVAAALAADLAALATAGEQFAALGANLAAAEAFAVAAGHAGRDRLAAGFAARAAQLRELCEGAVTPLLGGRALGALAQLSTREHEVAAMAAEGLSARQIGDRLFLSPRTVENYLQRVYVKLGATNRQELARYFPSG